MHVHNIPWVVEVSCRTTCTFKMAIHKLERHCKWSGMSWNFWLHIPLLCFCAGWVFPHSHPFGQIMELLQPATAWMPCQWRESTGIQMSCAVLEWWNRQVKQPDKWWARSATTREGVLQPCFLCNGWPVAKWPMKACVSSSSLLCQQAARGSSNYAFCTTVTVAAAAASGQYICVWSNLNLLSSPPDKSYFRFIHLRFVDHLHNMKLYSPSSD